MTRPAQPLLLHHITGDRMRLLQINRRLHHVVEGAQAKKVAKDLVAAQLLVIKPPETQAPAQQQNQEQQPAHP